MWRLSKLLRDPSTGRLGAPPPPPGFDASGLAERKPVPTIALDHIKTLTKRQHFNPDEHFLLVDLDFVKDSVLFGTDREQFYENVQAMKEVIVGYHRWQQRDAYYRWATRALQFSCVVCLWDISNHNRARGLFQRSLEDYVLISSLDIESLGQKKRDSLAAAYKELEEHPPDFAPIAAARLATATTPTKPHPMDTLRQEEAKAKREADEVSQTLSLMRASSLVGGTENAGQPPDADARFEKFAASPTSIAALKALRRILLPQADDFTSIVKEEILEYRKARAAEIVHPK